ncbi:PH domain-containing protein [Lentibacillus saliphilus]|uniref:PH domain-containing protein n=1 Tax=Lentibacillus saliphilus TaxID=2737028 RepID=UPI001C2FF0A1|nr:PH domain-containing protein [Lentibacillus saliphilus]
MCEPKRLHPVTVIFNMIRFVKEAALGLLGIGVIAIKDGAFFYIGIAVVVLITIIIVSSLLAWYRFTYEVSEDELRVKYGVFIRKKRYISKNRIQSIDLTQSVIHRIFGLVSVEIETAGSGSDKEASLKAVTYADGVNIRNQLKYGATTDTGDADAMSESEPVLTEDTPHVLHAEKVTFRQLFIAGTTSGSLGVLLALGGIAFSELEQFIPEHVYDEAWGWIVAQSIAIIVALVGLIFFVLWLLGIAGTMIKYGNFTISRHADDLFITRGLLEKKQITIPLKRIQAIGFKQSLLRQPFGYGTVYAEIAGGSLDDNREFSTILFPIMKKKHVNRFLKNVLPETAVMPETYNSVPARSRKFYVIRMILFPLALFVPVLIYARSFWWVPGLLLVGACILGFKRHRDAGVQRENKWLHIRTRGFALNHVVMHHKRIQAFEKRQHLIQKHQALATMEVSIVGMAAGGRHYAVLDMDDLEADTLSDWFSHRKEDGDAMRIKGSFTDQ